MFMRHRSVGRARSRHLAAGVLIAFSGLVTATPTDAGTVPPDDTASTSTDVDGAAHANHGGADPQDWVTIDETFIPDAIPSRDGQYIGPSISQPEYLDGIGAFRINCTFSHMGFDDPLVFPGQPDASHLHVFYGNDSVDAFSTVESIASTGGTTCTGGTVNRSAYWVPAVIDTATDAPVLPEGWDALQVYYKTGYRGVPVDAVQVMPAGLRIVAGDSTGVEPSDMNSVWYSCIGSVPIGGQPSFPECSPGDVFVMTVEFPQCWDGANLDSEDHHGHMAYADVDIPGGCPETHPVPLPVITQNYRYTVPAEGTSTWRLASDLYDGPAGYSGHADWWNGWDTDVFQRVVDGCYRTALDCKMNNLGDGERLE